MKNNIPNDVINTIQNINKLIGVSMIRNESDAVEAFVRYNLQLLDELHIIDHGSTDHTREILNALKAEGLPLQIYTYDENAYIQAEIVNKVIEFALSKDSNITHIFPLDADEFIYCPSRQKLNELLAQIPTDRVGMYTWRGYLPNTTKPDAHFYKNFTEQRQEILLTPKVIIPREVAKNNKVTIGSHYMIDNENKEVPSEVFRSPQHRHFYAWFEEKFNAQFIETDELWLGHFPIRSVDQQIKRTLEKSLIMALSLKENKAGDIAWENQLKDLLAKNMEISLEELRLIAFRYRATEEGTTTVAQNQVISNKTLELKYLHLVETSPLPTVARLILTLVEKLRT